MTDALLLQPSIRDPRGLALEPLMARLQRLDLSTLLVYAIKHVDASALPWLAEQLHVAGLEGWDLVASEAERRHLVAAAIGYHRLKGTLAGLRLAGARAGLAIVRAVTPPAKTYLAPTLTRTERDAFLARYPQLRLYPYRTRGVRLPYGWYCGAAFSAGRHYPAVTDAVLRLGWRSFIHSPDGSERAVTTLVREIVRPQAVAELDVAIHRPGAAGFGTYPTRLLPRSFLVTQDGGGRLFNLHLKTPYLAFDERLHAHAAPSGLTPIDIPYTAVAQPGTAHGAMLGRWVAGYLTDNGARDRLYRCCWLFDPAVPVPRRGRSTHVGAAMKLGMPAFTAELRVSVPGRRSLRLLGRFACGYWGGASTSRLARGAGSLRLAMALRDRVLLDTHDRVPVTSSSHILAGRYRAGQIISRST